MYRKRSCGTVTVLECILTMSRFGIIALIVIAVFPTVTQGTTDKEITRVFLEIVKEAEQHSLETVPKVLASEDPDDWKSLDAGKCFWVYPAGLTEKILRNGLSSKYLSFSENLDKRFIKFDVRSVGSSFYIVCAEDSAAFNVLAERLKARQITLYNQVLTASPLRFTVSRGLNNDQNFFVRVENSGHVKLELGRKNSFTIARTASVIEPIIAKWSRKKRNKWSKAYISSTPHSALAKPSPVTIILSKSRIQHRDEEPEQLEAAQLPFEPPSTTEALLARVKPVAFLKPGGSSKSVNLVCTECAHSRLVYTVVLNAVAAAPANKMVSLPIRGLE